MRRRSVSFGVVCSAIGAALLVFGGRLQLTEPGNGPLPVPPGSHEIAWLHTSTNAGTWERFVAGLHRACALVPGLEIDDSRAFFLESASTPEVVLRHPKHPHRLLIRWYKITAQQDHSDWIAMLAKREPHPLAIIGGGSTDRAKDLAEALRRQFPNPTDGPVFFITTATAERVPLEIQEGDFDTGDHELLGIYPHRSFRVCFTNRQMALAVLDFLAGRPELRPRQSPIPPASMVSTFLGTKVNPWHCWGPMLIHTEPFRPTVYLPYWADDPYSTDLADQFSRVIATRNPKSNLEPDDPLGDICLQRSGKPSAFPALVNHLPHLDVIRQRIAYSVGSFYRVNAEESETVQKLLRDRMPILGRRSLIVLPSVQGPARRVLQAFCQEFHDPTNSLVAIAGDGLTFNTVYRDRHWSWPMKNLPVPLVFFAHQSPIDPESPNQMDGIEDVRNFAEVVRLLVEGVYGINPDGGGAFTATELAERLHARRPAFFTRDGNRTDSGEIVVYLRPMPRGSKVEGILSVWERNAVTGWQRIWERPLE